MLREILYEMIHNSIFGSVAFWSFALLVLGCVVFFLLSWINKKHYKTYSKSLIRKFLTVYDNEEGKYEIRRIYFNLFSFLIISIILSSAAFFIWDWRVEKHHYKYVDNPLAAPTDANILFINDNRIKQNEWSQTESIQKLHVSETNPMTEINRIVLEDRIEQFEKIYKAGNKNSGKEDVEENQETKERLNKIRQIVTKMQPSTLDEYEKEFEYWCQLYDYYGYSSDLYQSSKVARNIMEVERFNLDVDKLLDIAGEAVSRGELFLEYANRNINSAEKPIIIDVEDIAFGNGKVFYQLYRETFSRNDLHKYNKEFISNAYVCMRLAKKEISEDDKDYAKIVYYLGNICQLMLNEISTGTDFYKEVANESLEYYELALKCMKAQKGFYNEEDNMRKNIEDGIETVKSLLEK